MQLPVQLCELPVRQLVHQRSCYTRGGETPGCAAAVVAVVSTLSRVTTIASAHRSGTAYRESLSAAASRERAPTGHNWRGVHLQRGSGVRTGQKVFYGSLWVHTSDVPTLFHDWGQSRCKETALIAPNDPYWAQCSQGSGWSGGTSSPLEPQMVVPSTPVPGATADTR